MKILMTGGGTGGHIYPAIAIADKFKERTLDAEVLFVGTQHGLEKELVPRSGYEIRFIDASGIDRRNLLKILCVERKHIAVSTAHIQERRSIRL